VEIGTAPKPHIARREIIYGQIDLALHSVVERKIQCKFAEDKRAKSNDNERGRCDTKYCAP